MPGAPQPCPLLALTCLVMPDSENVSTVGDAELERAQPHLRSWRVFLAELDWWITQHGDSLVPQAAVGRTVAGSPYPLGHRVKSYRVRYRRGLLEAGRARALEARPGWSWDGYSGRSAKIWDRRVAALLDFVAQHGSLAGLESVDPVLSRWLRDQRGTALTTEQRQQLSRIPAALEPRKGRLEEFLTAMHSWVAAEPDRDAGDVRFSTQHLSGSDTVPLGRRVAYWRSRYAAGQLEPFDVQAIETLPGWQWAPPSRRRPDESPV